MPHALQQPPYGMALPAAEAKQFVCGPRLVFASARVWFLAEPQRLHRPAVVRLYLLPQEQPELHAIKGTNRSDRAVQPRGNAEEPL